MHILCPKLCLRYILHLKLNFYVILDGKLNHMSCMRLLLKWNTVQRPKYPSSNPTANHFLSPNSSTIFGHTDRRTAINFQAWNSQSKPTNFRPSDNQKPDHKHKLRPTHTRSTNTNLNQSITKICREREAKSYTAKCQTESKSRPKQVNNSLLLPTSAQIFAPPQVWFGFPRGSWYRYLQKHISSSYIL